MSVLLNVNFQGNDKLSSVLEKMNDSAQKLGSQIGVLKQKISQLKAVELKFRAFAQVKKRDCRSCQ
ncbi:hypothetical protein [Moraxella sp.]|uniref:hypothetical protein n=1 Tax=Moraxella sp. TaxID=479 RepID=UPI0026DD06C6|nr:hypothetical protein [Moraxella sp.]MDO4895251.1 hypothetical protein [Moraxella sp.]